MTLIPRLAKPDSPRAMWNVSRSLSSWMPADSRPPLASNEDVTGDDKLLLTILFSLFSTRSSDVSPAAATAAAVTDDVPLLG